MLRPGALVLLLAFAVVSAGCPWENPCWELRCGDGCTLCAAEDFTCLQTESPHFCDASGTCVLVTDPAFFAQPGVCDGAP